MNKSLPARKIESPHAQPIGSRFGQRQACIFMMQNAAEATSDYVKQLAEIESGDQRIINLQQHTQAVPLTSQLLLIIAYGLEVQRVIDSDGHLPRDLLHEIDFAAIIVMRFKLSKAHGSKPALRCGQGSHAKRT